jgi:predicted secreted acid phosphatase
MSLEKYIQKINEAKDYLQTVEIKENSIIIFDIDDTLVDYFGNLIQPVYDFYNYIKTLNIKPVLITAREGNNYNINWTISQLKNLNINDYLYAFFKSPNEYNIGKFKELSRKVFHDKGFNVLMSIGDTFWDVGNYGGKSVLLK